MSDLKEIQQKYVEACARLGDLVFKQECEELEIDNLKRDLRVMNMEAKKLSQKLPAGEPLRTVAVPDPVIEGAPA